MIYNIYIYIHTLFRVDGSALFQSARIDGADFLNFDTRKWCDIHPHYFCGPRHLCQKMFQGCAIYARILKSKVSKPPFPFSSPFALNFPFLLPVPFLIPFPPFLSPFPFPSFPSSFPFTLYKWKGSVTYRWRNRQSWFPEEKPWSLSVSFSPFSFLLSLSPLPFPFVIPFPLSPSAFLFPLPFLNSLSLSPFSFIVLLSSFSLPFLFLLFPFSFSSSFSFPFTHGTQW